MPKDIDTVTTMTRTIVNSESDAFNSTHKLRKQVLVDSTEGLFAELTSSYDAQFSSTLFADGIIINIIAPTFEQRYDVTYNEKDHLLINAVVTEAKDSSSSRINALSESISFIGNSYVDFSTNNKNDIVATIKSPLDLDIPMGTDHNIDSLDAIYSLIKFVIDERFF